MKKSKAKIGKKSAAKAAKPAKKTPGRKPGKVAAKKLPAKRAAKVAPAKAAAKAPAKPAPAAAKPAPAPAPAKPVPAPAPAKAAPVAAKPAPAPAAAKPAPAPAPSVKKTIVVKAAKGPMVAAKPPIPVMPKRGRGRPPKNPRIVPPVQSGSAAAASAKPALVLSPALVKHAAPAPAKKQEVKERGDRRKKGVALVKGRRKADKLLVVFDSVPNHLVLAFRDGGVEDHRFKAKDDAKKCIQGLMAEGLAPQRIAYYSRHDYGLDVNVRL